MARHHARPPGSPTTPAHTRPSRAPQAGRHHAGHGAHAPRRASVLAGLASTHLEPRTRHAILWPQGLPEVGGTKPRTRTRVRCPAAQHTSPMWSSPATTMAPGRALVRYRYIYSYTSEEDTDTVAEADKDRKGSRLRVQEMSWCWETHTRNRSISRRV